MQMGIYKLIRILIFSIILLISQSAFSDENSIVIQVNGKYLSLIEAAGAKQNLVLKKINNKWMLKFKNSDYPVNSENISLLFGVEHLIINFENSFPNTRIYLDDSYKGTTDEHGYAHFPQIYPKTGKHKLQLMAGAGSKDRFSFEFNFVRAIKIACSGRKDFSCQILKI